MADSREDLRRQLDEALETAKRLRDEIRVNLHLAGMDARDKWNELEPKVMQEAERIAREATDNARSTLDGIVQRLREFRETLRRQPEEHA